MKLFPSAKALLAILLGLVLVSGLSACGGAGGESDTDAPMVSLAKIPVSTIERTRALSGEMEPGAQVEVSADTAAVPGPVTVGAGVWSSSINLVLGVNTISVKATDATGNNQTLAFALLYEVVTLDQVLPATALADQTLWGTLATGASLTATLDTASAALTPVIVDNNWSLDLAGLAGGTHTLTLTGTDTAAIPQTTTLTQTLVIDSGLPLLTMNPAAPVGNAVSLSGTATVNATVTIVASTGATVGTITQPAGNGTWSCELSELVPGRNIITITATTTATDGTTATASAQLAVLYQP